MSNDPLFNTRGGTFDHAAYDRRARTVYWNRSYPACRAKGPRDKATCLLEPDHDGDHFGNGYDTFGPKGPYAWRPDG